ncbi:hypothetical protein HZ326_22051 [Fusarium oxysporum f. sp. albedinis]|nr:hypothetical protein HZ326_22051 [Fusarium oxysporum f. sp. albedinis]
MYILKNSPQQREPFQLASRTKSYEGAVLKFGWKFGEIISYQTDNPPTPSIKASQLKQDSPSELDAEPTLGNANQCITSVGKSDDVSKSPKTRKGKEPAKGEIHDNKESGLGEAST